MAEIYRRSEMLKTFLVEDEVVIREMIKKMIPCTILPEAAQSLQVP